MENLNDLLAEYGIVENESLELKTLEILETGLSPEEIKRGNIYLPKYKDKMGGTQMVLMPGFLVLPWDPFKDFQKKTVSNLNYRKTPDEFISILCELAKKNEEFKLKLHKALGIGKSSEHFELTLTDDGTKQTDLFIKRTIDLFKPYWRPYTMTETIQVYNLGGQYPTKALSLLKTSIDGSVDSINSDQDLYRLYEFEKALAKARFEQVYAEECAKLDTKPTEQDIKKMKSEEYNKNVMKYPRKLTVALAFVFDVDTNGVLISDEASKMKTANYDIVGNLYYMSISSTFIESVSITLNTNDFLTLNYIPLFRLVPKESPEIVNIGVAISKATVTKFGDKEETKVETQIKNLYEKVEEALLTSDKFDVTKMKSYVREFNPIEKMIVIQAIKNNIAEYGNIIKNADIQKNFRSLLMDIKPELVVTDGKYTLPEGKNKMITEEFGEILDANIQEDEDPEGMDSDSISEEFLSDTSEVDAKTKEEKEKKKKNEK